MSLYRYPSPGTPRFGQRGFTLLEVLIAVAITALIGIGIWQVLSGVIASKHGVDRTAGAFEKLQRTVLWLERDIGQAVQRPIRDTYGDTQPAMTSRADNYDLVLTRQGWRNPLGDPRSELQRVGYSLDNKVLHRWQWQVLDQAQDTVPLDQVLLDDVDEFTVRFLDAKNNWADQWPPAQTTSSATATSTGAEQMPKAVEVTLKTQRFGEIKRILTLPDFSAVDKVAAGSSGAGAGEQSPQDQSGEGLSGQNNGIGNPDAGNQFGESQDGGAQ